MSTKEERDAIRRRARAAVENPAFHACDYNVETGDYNGTWCSVAQDIPLLCDELDSADQQIERLREELKGKRLTPDRATTFCICPDCGAATRWSYHLDTDCDTIKKLKAELQEQRELVEWLWVLPLNMIPFGRIGAEAKGFAFVQASDTGFPVEFLGSGDTPFAALHAAKKAWGER